MVVSLDSALLKELSKCIHNAQQRNQAEGKGSQPPQQKEMSLGTRFTPICLCLVLDCLLGTRVEHLPTRAELQVDVRLGRRVLKGSPALGLNGHMVFVTKG